MPFGRTLQKPTPTLFAGRFRHRVSLVVTNPTQDTTGGVDLNTTVLYATVWGTVEALLGDEQFATQEQVSKTTHQVTIRYIGAAPSWHATLNYLDGAFVVDANGNLQNCTVGGLSGATAPTWNASLYGYTTDGDPSTGVTWRNLGPAPVRTGVSAAMQIVWQGRKFQITSVLNPDGRNKVLVLMCVEINDSNQQSPIVGGVTGPGGIGTVLDGGVF